MGKRFEHRKGKQQHPLEVTLTRREGTVHCRRAYFVGPKTP